MHSLNLRVSVVGDEDAGGAGAGGVGEEEGGVGGERKDVIV